MISSQVIAKGVVVPAFGLFIAAAANAYVVRTWDFNNTLLENQGGESAVYMEGAGGSIAPAAVSYTTSMIAGQSATVAQINVNGALKILYNLDANNYVGVNPATKVNRYTVMADVKFDAATWISILQLDQTNESDGSMFLYRNSDGHYEWGKGSGAGNIGYWGDFDATAWHRIAWAVNCEPTQDAHGDWRYAGFDMYVDGAKINVGMDNPWMANDSYWSLNSNQSGNPWLYLFADNDGDTTSGLINSLAIGDECLTAEQVAYFGGADAAGISTKLGINPVPEPATMIALGLGVAGLMARRRRKN